MFFLAQVTGVQVRVGQETPEELPEEIPDEFETPQVGNLDDSDVDSKFVPYKTVIHGANVKRRHEKIVCMRNSREMGCWEGERFAAASH